MTANLTEWAERALLEARGHGHDPGPWTGGATAGVAILAACNDCLMEVTVSAGGAIAGLAVRRRCEGVIVRTEVQEREVAKCWTCGVSDPNAARPGLTWAPRHVTGGDVARHRAAGHDVRPA